MPLSQLPGMAGEGTSIVLEFLGILRRSLACQAPVKQVLYRGIGAIVAADAQSVDNLLPLLFPQLQKYLKALVGVTPCAAVSSRAPAMLYRAELLQCCCRLHFVLLLG